MAQLLQVNNRLDGSIPSNTVNNRNEPSGVEKLIRKWTLEDGTEEGVPKFGKVFEGQNLTLVSKSRHDGANRIRVAADAWHG